MYTPETVPSYVPQEYRVRWAAIWNHRYTDEIKAGKTREDAEEAAFRLANGVIKKAKQASEGNGAVPAPPPYLPPHIAQGWGDICAGAYAMALGLGKSPDEAEKQAVQTANAWAAEQDVKQAEVVKYYYEAVMNPATTPPMTVNPDYDLTLEKMRASDAPVRTAMNAATLPAAQESGKPEPPQEVKPTDSNPEALAPKDAITVLASSATSPGFEKVSAEVAVYMELKNAKRDIDCAIVKVPGGVSSDLGCCDLYWPEKKADKFVCGQCKHAIKHPASEATAKANAIEMSEHRGKPMPFAVLLSTVVPIAAMDGKEVQDIPIACTGTWHKDEEFSITPQDLDSLVSNFEKRKNGQVVIDYEHASEHPVLAKGQPIPAAGWIHNLYVRGSQLVARVEWTPQAKGMIQNGEYRFFSPAINWGVKDKASGEYQGATLTSGALTNHPFLEELPPILLSEELIGVGQAHIPAAMGAAAPQATAQATADTAASEKCTSTNVDTEMADRLKLDKDHASVGGEPVHRDSFLYVGDPDKKETWALPVPDEAHIRNALARFNQTDTIPASEKSKVAKKLVALAKKHGIDTSGFEKAQARHLAEKPTMKSQAKKITDGKFAGRYGRYAEDGKLLMVLPKSMTDEAAMAEFCAELDESDPAAGKAQPGPAHVEPEEAKAEPAGAFLDDKDGDADGDEPDADDESKAAMKAAMKASEASPEPAEELTASEILRLITYPAGDKRVGRVNLSEVTRLVEDEKIKPSVVFRAQAAEKAVDEAISAGKFLPKQRPHLMRQALTDLKGFEEFVASTPKQDILTRTIGLGSDGSENSPVSDVQKAIKAELSEHKGEKDYTEADALRDATRKNPELWDSYRAATAKSAANDRD